MVATVQRMKRIKVLCGANPEDFELSDGVGIGNVRKELGDLLNIPPDAKANLMVTDPDTGKMTVTEDVSDDVLVPADSVLEFVRPEGVGVKG